MSTTLLRQNSGSSPSRMKFLCTRCRRRAVKKSGVPWALQVVIDGQEALDFFNGTGKFADRNQFPMPSLVFLDLKLPYLNGFEVLTEMQKSAKLKQIPV